MRPRASSAVLAFWGGLIMPGTLWACPAPGEIVRPRVQARDGGEVLRPVVASRAGDELERWTFPLSLGGVSSYNSDCRPTMSTDGTLAVWEAADNTGPPYDPENHTTEHFHIYEATWDGEQWTNVRGLDGDDFFNHHHPALSSDGERLYTTARNQIRVSTREGSDWSVPVALTGEINDGRNSSLGAATVTADETEIYFSAMRSGGEGANDIWVCRLQGDYTDSLTHLGTGVNSSGADVRPAISPDGTRLIFSDFGGGRVTLDYGGVDVFISEKVDGVWMPATPVPAPVNNDQPACSAHWVNANEVLLGGGVIAGCRAAEDIWVTAVDGEVETPSLQGALRLPGKAQGGSAGRRSAPVRSQTRERNRGVAAGGPLHGGAGDLALPFPGKWRVLHDLPDAAVVEDLFTTSEGTLLAATSNDGYIFRSVDEGAIWARSRLLGVTRVYRFYEESNGDILAGTYPEGRIYRSRDDGRRWRSLGRLPSWITAARAMLELDSGDLLVGVSPDTVSPNPFVNSEGRVFRSRDRGQTWESSGSLKDIVSTVCALTQQDDGTIWAGGRGKKGMLYRSDDDGYTWTSVNPDYAPPPSIGTAARFFRDSRGTLWAMGWGHGAHGAQLLTFEGGSDWHVTYPFKRGEYRDGFVFDMAENDLGWLFAGTQGALLGDSSWISRDGGVTWRDVEPLDGSFELMCLEPLSGGRMLGGTSGDGRIWLWERTALSAPR